MNEREHRRPLIVESWDGADPLEAFALERPKTPNPPLPLTASADDREVAVGFTEPRIARRTHRPTAFIMGVAGLVGVAAATIVLLSMYVGSMPSGDEVTTVARLSDSEAAQRLESSGQIAEQEVVPEAVHPSPRAADPPAAPPLTQERAATRVEREQVKKAAKPSPAETRIVGTTGRPAPIPSSAPRTPARPIVTDTPPPPSSTPVVPTSAPPVLAPSAVTVAPSVATAPPPADAVAVPPPSTVTPAPADNVAVAPASAVTAAANSAAAQSAITAVLRRYAAAFNALDVQQVRAIWPQVNQDALKRAFSALSEQKFDLGNCDIWITGANAVASCAGRAAYTPKVGNRTRRSEAREWTFYLDQNDLWWSIASVQTR